MEPEPALPNERSHSEKPGRRSRRKARQKQQRPSQPETHKQTSPETERRQNILQHHLLKPSRWREGPRVRLGAVALLEGPGGTPSDTNLSSVFLASSARVMEIKTRMNKWDLIKLKSLRTTKETINKIKRQPAEWEKIPATLP